MINTISVVCPKCKSLAGYKCGTPSGASRRMVHKVRENAARLEAKRKASVRNRLTRERIEGIRGRAALHYDAAESDVLSLCSMALEAVDGGWISVQERLPEKGILVLAYSPEWDFLDNHFSERQHVTSVVDYTGKRTFTWFNWDISQKTTHWKPLPTPPASSLEALSTAAESKEPTNAK